MHRTAKLGKDAAARNAPGSRHGPAAFGTARSYRVARPYSQLAATYDQTLGWASFVRTRRAFERLVRHYGIRFASAADLGCGTGLFACYLGRHWGVPVFAVDRSPEMLRVARCNCPDSRVCWLRQDLRCLRLPCPVDLATANFDTVNHLLTPPSLRCAFQGVYANLRPGGWFVFDFVTPRLPRDGIRAYFRRFRNLGLHLLRRIRWDPQARILSIQIVRRGPRGCVPEMEVHRERAYTPRQVTRWLRAAGFLVRGLHDAWTLRSPQRCPERMIVVAQKPRRREPGPIQDNRLAPERLPEIPTRDGVLGPVCMEKYSPCTVPG